MERKNILWLVSWYPNRNDPFDGDFIQRHARAAAIYHNIHVVFVAPADGIKPVEIDWQQTSGLTEQLIYFRQKKHPFSRVAKQLRWRKLFLQAVEEYIHTNGKPHLVHVHVPWKAGLIALELKRRYGLSFLITEHWGIYNSVVQDRFQTRSLIVQWLFKKIFTQSELLLSPSKYLANSINRLIAKNKFVVVPNVVDTSLFYFKGIRPPSAFTFIHVSNMVPLKNVLGILRAMDQLVSRYGCTDIRLVLVGANDTTYKQEAIKLGLFDNAVFFKGEVSYAAVAREMQSAHCLVLNSHMENSPCVIGEAHCCGLPVIATKVGGVPELLNEANGILIEPNDEEGLVGAMLQIQQQYPQFDQAAIAAEAQAKYRYASIGKQMDSVYQLF